MHEQACCHDEAANHQLHIAMAFWIIQIVSVEQCSSLMQNSMQIHCSTCSVILNVTATPYTCSFNSVYCPHWLVQWSHHCSHMHIPVHSPGLPGYINVIQTILAVLIMVGLFPDRPRTCFDFGWWAHNAIYRWCIIDLYTWNLYNFINQCHHNKCNFKKFNPFIVKNPKSCVDTNWAFSIKQLIIQIENVIMSFKTTAFSFWSSKWMKYVLFGSWQEGWLTQTR